MLEIWGNVAHLLSSPFRWNLIDCDSTWWIETKIWLIVTGPDGLSQGLVVKKVVWKLKAQSSKKYKKNYIWIKLFIFILFIIRIQNIMEFGSFPKALAYNIKALSGFSKQSVCLTPDKWNDIKPNDTIKVVQVGVFFLFFLKSNPLYFFWCLHCERACFIFADSSGHLDFFAASGVQLT